MTLSSVRIPYTCIMCIWVRTRMSAKFTPDDSVVFLTVNDVNVEKYGNSIHRDKDLLAF